MRTATSIFFATLTALPLLVACDPQLDDEVTLREGVCDGIYETHTQSQWGAACIGGNTGCQRDAHFMQVFPEGLIVGCGVLTANLVTSVAVQKALPTAGVARALLPGEAVAFDGAGDPKVATSLFGQVVALALNVGFDEWAVASELPLEALIIADPLSPCVGMSVGEVLLAANQALGGCDSSLDPATAQECTLAINRSYAFGQTCSPLFRTPDVSGPQ